MNQQVLTGDASSSASHRPAGFMTVLPGNAMDMDSPGMHGHFQVLAADERFSSLPIGLYRNVGADLVYEIVVSIEDERLDLVAELAEWASERGLESRFNDLGQVALFEPVLVPA